VRAAATVLAAVAVIAPGAPAAADAAATPPAASPDPRDAPPGDCLHALDTRGVPWKPARRPGIALAVEVTGAIAGVTYASTDGPRPLVLDCSLVVSLAEAGAYMTALGIDHATYSSAYQVRTVRGTQKPSKHSFGLAIDVHTFSGPSLGTLSVERDFEQGLGDDIDCIGAPLTQGGALLKILECQLVRSGLFFLVLNPDYDADHYNHFHLEARPWQERPRLRADHDAIH
jgi:hypothetical protein